MTTIIINGRLAAKPTEKVSQKGSKYLEFTIGSGTKEEVVWYRCCWFNPNPNVFVHLDKGSAISVTGKLSKPKVYQKKDGTHDVNLSVMVSDLSFLPTNKAGEVKQSASVFH